VGYAGRASTTCHDYVYQFTLWRYEVTASDLRKRVNEMDSKFDMIGCDNLYLLSTFNADQSHCVEKVKLHLQYTVASRVLPTPGKYLDASSWIFQIDVDLTVFAVILPLNTHTSRSR
jgi:hypothetical protein